MKKIICCLAHLTIVGVTSAQNCVYYENFESTSPSCTTTGVPGFVPQNILHASGNIAAWSNVAQGSSTSLITDAINISGLTDVYLDFKHICKMNSFDVAQVYVSKDNGNYELLTASNTTYYPNVDEAYNNGVNSMFNSNSEFNEFCYIDWEPMVSSIPNNGWWKREVFKISSLVLGATNIQIKFVLEDANFSNNADRAGWAIDDIVVCQDVCGIDPPTVVNTTLFSGQTTEIGPYLITADILDDQGILTADIFYSLDDGLTYYQDEMIPSNDISFPDQYMYYVPEVLYGQNILYYFKVIDNSSCNEIITTSINTIAYVETYIQFCQDPSSPISNNINCNNPEPLCYDREVKFNFNPVGIIPTLYYSFYVKNQTQSSLHIIFRDGVHADIKLFGPVACNDPSDAICNGLASFDTPDGPFGNSSVVGYDYYYPYTLDPGYYVLAVQPDAYSGCISMQYRITSSIYCNCPSEPCIDCIGSFAPEPGKDYILSAWVKQDNASNTVTTYTAPNMSMNFISSGGGSTAGPFYASGLIIDGWQRIHEKISIPSGTDEIELNLTATSANSYFDDIRIFPFDGSMKSFVYDPITKLFIAELDENNYATFFEYDEEGKLTRLKKETERGIMTIKENRNNNPR